MKTLVALLVVLTTRLSYAAPNVGVVVAGEPTLQAKVRAEINVWVQQHGYALIAKPLSIEAAKTLANCFVIEDTACARGVIEHQSKADHLIYVRVDLGTGSAKDKEREVSFAGYWFLKDRDAVADKRTCKPCGNGPLNQSVIELMNALYDASGLGKGRLRIGTPPGLVVTIDGANVGLTPVEQDVTPGTHTIALVRDGKEVGTTNLNVSVGDVKDVVVPIKSLEPAAVKPETVAAAPPDQGESRPPVEHPSRIVPGLLIVGGAGAIAVGGVFVYYGHKNGPDDPLIYPNATKEGAVIASLGGVALITGLVLWWRGSSSTNGPTAAVGSSGTIVGWTGRF